MKIASIRAAAVSDPRLWSDPDAPLREWNKGTNSTNPLSRYRELLGQGHRFQTPWSMVVCVVEATDGTFGVGVSIKSQSKSIQAASAAAVKLPPI